MSRATLATPSDDPQPVPPVQPDLDDCCHSGCNPCVFDLYDEALDRYQATLAQWQERRQRQVAQASVPTQATPKRPSKPRQRRGSG
ncbi:oxidoreductase-like domain-containing protein [Paraburkholderia bryophila]|uniref:oxidoreductase-like domain-containing protein n=1 Tax=Burkholderiaceae TaxID=119060 RepID=UPI00054FEA42|nr:oxidoreductase-like domain-containing protein [Burkholderia sp. 9120]